MPRPFFTICVARAFAFAAEPYPALGSPNSLAGSVLRAFVVSLAISLFFVIAVVFFLTYLFLLLAGL
jgi:hypothetical protein